MNFDLDKIREEIISNMKKVYDPEIPVNIYDLGLIYEINFEQKDNYLFCTIVMTLTSPACPVAESLVDEVKYVTTLVNEVDEAKVNLTFTPMWSQALMSEEAKEIMAASGAAI